MLKIWCNAFKMSSDISCFHFQVFVWVEIPCVDNLGSCTYVDGCSMIPFKAGQPCPAPLSTYNLPCTCPFQQVSIFFQLLQKVQTYI